jgi:hypothetical protein
VIGTLVDVGGGAAAAAAAAAARSSCTRRYDPARILTPGQHVFG